MTTRFQLEAAGGSHAGLLRKSNEDCFASLPELGLFVVADGIGGHAAGEVASRMAVDLVRDTLAEDDPDETWPYSVPRGMDRDEARFVRSLRRANHAIYKAARRNASQNGMGTTFAGVLVTDSGAYIAHVGDSRVYRYRSGRLEQLTRDHTVLEDLLRKESPSLDALGGLDDQIAHRITRAIGMDCDVEVETRVVHPKAGDVFLVCSDGLSGPVPAGEIAATLAWPGRPEAIVAGLIGRAIEHGGPDNVTCVVMRFAAMP